MDSEEQFGRSTLPPPPPPPPGTKFITLDPDFLASLLKTDKERQTVDQPEVGWKRFGPRYVALDEAVQSGNAKQVLETLVEARRLDVGENTIEGAIKTAIQCHRLDIMLLLIQNGVKAKIQHLEAAVCCGFTPAIAHLMQVFDWKIDQLLSEPTYGKTLLGLAVEHAETVQWLLSNGADVNKLDSFSATALSYAAQKGSLRVIEILLHAGANVKQGAVLAHAAGRTCDDAKFDIMKDLLERGAPPNDYVGENSPSWGAVGFERETALHYVCKAVYRSLPCAQLLLAYGADPHLNRRVHDQETPNTSVCNIARAPGLEDVLAAVNLHIKKSDLYG